VLVPAEDRSRAFFPLEAFWLAALAFAFPWLTLGAESRRLLGGLTAASASVLVGVGAGPLAGAGFLGMVGLGRWIGDGGGR